MQGLITVVEEEDGGGGVKQMMIQGVQDTYDTYPLVLDREKKESNSNICTLVLIGKHLDGARLQEEFSRILTTSLW